MRKVSIWASHPLGNTNICPECHDIWPVVDGTLRGPCVCAAQMWKEDVLELIQTSHETSRDCWVSGE